MQRSPRPAGGLASLRRGLDTDLGSSSHADVTKLRPHGHEPHEVPRAAAGGRQETLLADCYRRLTAGMLSATVNLRLVQCQQVLWSEDALDRPVDPGVGSGGSAGRQTASQPRGSPPLTGDLCYLTALPPF